MKTSNSKLESDPRNWKVVNDPKSERVFYYNEVLDKSVWKKPDCLKSPIEKIPIEPWTKYHSTNGKTYYHNSETNETTWTIPREVVLKRQKYKTEAESSSFNSSSDSNSTVSSLSFSTANTSATTTSSTGRSSIQVKNILANGYGDSYKWITLNEAFHLAKIDKKPIFLLIHKSWCKACKYLAPIVANSRSILELSQKFYMVNACDDDEPKSDTSNKFAPDGKYNPRLLFYDPQGNLMPDVICEEDKIDPFKYYYTTENSIVRSMKQCLRKLEKLNKL